MALYSQAGSCTREPAGADLAPKLTNGALIAVLSTTASSGIATGERDLADSALI